MTFDARAVTAALNKMFLTQPLPTANANPIEAAKVYLEVCQPYCTADILAAIDDFKNGKVSGFNKSFAPSAPVFATHLRSIEAKRVRLESIHRDAVLQIAQRDRDDRFHKLKTPASRAKVKSMLDAFNAKMEAKKDERTPEQKVRDAELLRKMETRVPGEFVEHGSYRVSQSLLKNLKDKGFSVGDPEGDGDVA